jgi:hypothetical protein
MPFFDIAIIALASAWFVVILIGAVTEHLRLRRDEWRGVDRTEIPYWDGYKPVRWNRSAATSARHD